MERVIVTGSNIPTAEELGPNPVDTYRPQDIEKLGARNATDLLTKLPQQMGSTINQNANGVAGGDGSVIPNLRGLLPKETLVLIDGKRAAIIGSGGGVAAGASPGVAGVDINLIPFPMIDHIDISEGWRLGYLWQRCGGRCVQYLFETQIPWSGDWKQYWQHQPGLLQ